MERFCEVIIIKQNQEYIGYIHGLKQNITFNPLTILPELRYKIEALTLEESVFDDFDYAYECAFEHIIEVDNREQYYKLVLAIKNIIEESYRTQSIIDLYKFEFLKYYFDITFQFTPIYNVPNMYKKYCSYVEEFTDLPIHYSQFSVENALQCDLSKCCLFFYDCYTLSDAIYSILHFLAINKYKFERCHHCGQFFATKSYKQKYCPRNSFYPEFEHLNCEQAVRNIFQKIRREQRKIYHNLNENYYQDHLNSFQEQFNSSFETCKKHPTYVNIDKCFAVLTPSRWYTKPSIRNVGIKNKSL